MDWQTIAVWLVVGIVIIGLCTKILQRSLGSSRRKPPGKGSPGCGCGCGDGRG